MHYVRIMRTWFTSDLHFGHRNIIGYCGRPWGTVEAMNAGLIEGWNAVVAPEDRVYVLGDFSLHGRADAVAMWLGMLKGEKHLVRGNHDDKRTYRNPVLVGWASVSLSLDLSVDGVNVRLNHHPLVDWRGPRLLLHGHSHSKSPKTGDFSFDVGVDANGYRPQLVSKFSGMV